jgi:putative ABC transport system permease protein
MSLTRFFRRRYWDEERARELAAYLEAETDENIARGMSPEEARYAAYRKLGNTKLIREEIYHMNSLDWLETLWQDFRFALRMLGKNPGFTAVAVISLALGIGVNTTFFSIVDGYFLRPLPIKDARQLVMIKSQPYGVSSYPDYQDICHQTATFKSVAALARHVTFLMTNGVAEMLRADYVSENFFSVLDVSPVLGHTFESEGSRKDPTAGISYGLWQRRFGGAADAVGKVVRFNGRNVTIVGVAPQWFRGLQKGDTTDIYFPVDRWEWRESLAQRDFRDYDLMGRLQPGANLAQARAELATMASRFSAAYPATDKGMSFELTTEAEQFPAVLRLSVELMAAVGLVLVICCANVAGMALAKGEARRRELAVRKALGAGRGRLLRQLLTESLVLAVVGGGLGLILTTWLVSLQPALLPPSPFPVHFDIRVDSRVLAFTIFASLFAALISGLFPALHGSNADLVSMLKGGEESTSRARPGLLGRNLLVVGQIALSVVLLVVAGLLVKSLMVAARTNPGFDPRKNLLTVNLGPSQGREQCVRSFYTPVVERIKALPGVKQASYAMRVPLSDAGSGVEAKVSIPGVELPPGQDPLRLHYNSVGLNYFRTVGARILRGRDFTQEDEASHRRTILINETMARRFWPNKDPLGQVVRFQGGNFAKGDFEIIGVVEDGKNAYIHEAPQPYGYVLYAQVPWGEGTLLVETTGDPRAIVDPVKREIRALDKGALIFDIITLKQLMHSALWEDRMPALLLGTLALLGMFLATVGLYGVTAFIVNRRTHEIGIRMALGAERHEVVEFILAGSAKLTGAGILIGLAAALAISRLMAHYLYGVRPRDPVVFTLCSLAALIVALLAAYIPATRATKVDPIVALRYE